MEKKLINNLGIKILSICLAAFAWVVIVNIDDPIKSKTFTNVAVEVLNDNVLEEKNLAYSVEAGSTVDFTVTGKRTVIEKLKKSDFTVTADLSELTQPYDTVKINVECSKYPSLNITMGKISTMTVSSEEKISEKFSVKVVMSGAPAPGYAADTPEVSPVIVEVTAAESVVQKIEEVRVLVDISGASEEISKTVTPKAYDSKGREIPSEQLDFSYNTVNVKIPLLETKEVPVELTTNGKPADGYEFAGADYQPQTIEVKGSKEALEKIESIPVTVDINGLKDNKEFTISILEKLSDYNVSPVDSDVSSIVVSVTINKHSGTEFTFNYDDITINNLEDGYELLNAETTDSFTVTLTGESETLKDITAASLQPTINAKDLAEGEQTVTVSFTLPDGVKQASELSIKVDLEPEEDVTVPVPSPSPSEEASEDIDKDDADEPSESPSESVKPSQETDSDSEDNSSEEEEE